MCQVFLFVIVRHRVYEVKSGAHTFSGIATELVAAAQPFESEPAPFASVLLRYSVRLALTVEATGYIPLPWVLQKVLVLLAWVRAERT
jgi:hypothetical protein